MNHFSKLVETYNGLFLIQVSFRARLQGVGRERRLRRARVRVRRRGRRQVGSTQRGAQGHRRRREQKKL